MVRTYLKIGILAARGRSTIRHSGTVTFFSAIVESTVYTGIRL